MTPPAWLPWLCVCAALIVLGAKQRDGWVIALAIAALLAAVLLHA